MTKNKNNQAIWGARIMANTSSIFEKAGSSIDIDKRLYKEDIAASIAHVEMLFKQKIISFRIMFVDPLDLLVRDINIKLNKNKILKLKILCPHLL